jgi:hypothetical protein
MLQAGHPLGREAASHPVKLAEAQVHRLVPWKLLTFPARAALLSSPAGWSRAPFAPNEKGARWRPNDSSVLNCARGRPRRAEPLNPHARAR